MRISTFVALTLVTAAAFAQPAAAAYNLPWCARYYGIDVWSCAFTSFEQCMASVSGIGGHCTRNLLYPLHAPYAESHGVKSRRLLGDDRR
jgi:hypothetical protein